MPMQPLRHRASLIRTRLPRMLALYTALGILGAAGTLTGCSHEAAAWKLTDVTGHLPDLSFSLTEIGRAHV